MYEHHLLAVSLLTGCELHPGASKIAALLHDARETLSFKEYFLDKHLGRGQQGSLNYPNVCSTRGTWWLSTCGHHPDAL